MTVLFIVRFLFPKGSCRNVLVDGTKPRSRKTGVDSAPLSLSVRLRGEQKAASESGRRTPEEKKAAALQRCGE